MKKLIEKILNQRKHLIKNDLSGKNKMRCFKIIDDFELWINFYPNSETGLKNKIRKQINDIRYVCASNPSGDALFDKVKKELI